MSDTTHTAAANTLWARVIADELARSGVRQVIVAPGSRSTPLVMAFADDGRFSMRVHLDERSAAFFALGVGKASGEPAAVVTTSGTAVANCLPAVVEASQSGVPLLILTADRPHRLRGADANQAIDQVGIYGRFVRAFHEVAPPTTGAAELRHLRALVCRAVAATVGADAGPVHLNVPFDKPLEPVEDADSSQGRDREALEGRRDGAPFTAIRGAAQRLDEDALSRLMARLRGRRCVLVAGPTEDPDGVGPAVLALSRATGFPVLADPLSGARYAPKDGAHVVAAYDLFLGGPPVEALAPELVLRVGASPTSAALQGWLLAHRDVPHVVVDAGGRWKDHAALATDYVIAEPAHLLHSLAIAFSKDQDVRGEPLRNPGKGGGNDAGSPADEWSTVWRLADAAAREALAAGRDEAHPHEGEIVADVLGEIADGGALVVSNSMPIRDLDSFGHPRDEHVRVFANRGASGIDGIVSTAFGVASQVDSLVTCVIGDVAFFHDTNGLLWNRESDVAVVFVVIDNDGGGIFHMLPIAEHDPSFTRYFATPHGLDPRHVAALHGIRYEEVTPRELGGALATCHGAERSAILRVRTDRGDNHARHVLVREAVARSVRHALG